MYAGMRIGYGWVGSYGWVKNVFLFGTSYRVVLVDTTLLEKSLGKLDVGWGG